VSSKLSHNYNYDYELTNICLVKAANRLGS
jgi:hypothetical protein